MNKILRKLLTVFTAVMCIIANAQQLLAAQGTINMKTSRSEVEIGETFTVTVEIECKGGSMADMSLSYSNTYLELVEYPENDYNRSNGRLLVDAASSDKETRTFVFRTLAKGSTTVYLSVIKFVSIEGSEISGYGNSLTTTVNIVEKTDKPDEKPSDDATIKNISITNGKLEPDFSPEITEYKVYLPEKTGKLDLTVYTNSEKATVQDYDTSLSEGWNDVMITCVAEDSSTRTYVIRAYVEEEPTVFYELNGERLGVVKNLDKVEYERFKKKETRTGSDTITVFTGSYFRLLYLINEKGEKDFYLYDKNKNKVTELFRPLTYNNMYYVAEDANYSGYPYMEEDFIRTKVRIADREVYGWSFRDNSQQEFEIVCLTDEKGDTQLYKLDTRDNTVQRYVHPGKKENRKDLPVYVYIAGGRAGLVMIALAIAMINRKKN